ncbi:MAG: polysulfide reductase NrfD [Chloroflexi bacterium]|nr:polysulfide reductase NrfD [Chloroflexota bacterium]
MQARALKTIFWVTGAILFLVGTVGWYDRLTRGHLDANYGSLVPWGLWVAAYIYFIGLSAGSFLISSLVYVFGIKRFEAVGRLSVFTAIVTLLLALLSIWVDLGHMDRAWHVLVYPNFKSPMAWMIWLYSTYFLLLVVEFWFLIRRDMVVDGRGHGFRASVHRVLSLGSHDASDASAERDRKVVRVLATIGVPVAIMFHGGVGALFGVVAARPLWNSGLFPILFLLSALASGGALLTLVATIFQHGWTRNRETVLALGQLVLGLLLLDVLFQFSELLVGFYSGSPDHLGALQAIVGGSFWWVFWGWQIVLGTLLPILLLVLPTRKDPRFVSLAGLLIAAGFLAVRLNIVIPGFTVEEVRGITAAFASARVSTNYFPSMMEWLVSIGIAGLGLLMFGFGEMLMPEEPEHKEPVVPQPIRPHDGVLVPPAIEEAPYVRA